MSTEMLACRCCGYLTVEERNHYEICPVCFWEDDEYQFENPDSAGGANKVSLIQARLNYKEFGAKELRCVDWVRPPLPEEIP